VNINIDCCCKKDKKTRKHSNKHKCDCHEHHECDCCEDHECDCCEDHECDCCEHMKCDCCTDVIAKILSAVQDGQSSSHCDKKITINININNK